MLNHKKRIRCGCKAEYSSPRPKKGVLRHILAQLPTLFPIRWSSFAVRTGAKTLFSVALMDKVCPPSTVFAAYNCYAGPKDIRIWSYNHYASGGSHQNVGEIRFLHEIFGEKP